MCSSPACNQPADSTVHQRCNSNTGPEPLAPKRSRLSRLGARKLKMLSVWMPFGSTTSIIK